ncbi:MAG: cation:proton antiporter [Alphaproteobacteria bacterium]|nr:cation:proton antiporter [Alphaproteobacteria bacterium]
MHEGIQITEIALVVLIALTGGLILSRLKQPPVLGYILTGVILGPSCFALIQSRDQVEILAELGVLLLLFVVGMELNLRTFKRVWVTATLCTVLQIFVCVSIPLGCSTLLGWSMELSLLLGFVASLSSTAVVVKMLESIGELKTETGQLTIGILIAQDLAIVPMIIILRNYSESLLSPMMFIKIIGSIGMIVALITYLSRRHRVHVPLVRVIAGEKDLVPLACLTFCFLAAAGSGLMGLSAPYGAFLAGLVLGNTHERLLVIETTKPIQSILLMVFFLSIGLLLDIGFIWINLQFVLLLLFLIVIGKTALNIFILRLLRLSWSQSFLIGVTLAQLGEFAFLMTTIANQAHIITDFGQRLIISITALSLAFSPLWMATARRLKDLADANTISLRKLLNLVYGREVSSALCYWRRAKDWSASKPHADQPSRIQFLEGPVTLDDDDE